MLITEWNMEEAREVWQEEAREEGLAEGRAEGYKTIALNLLAEGSTPEFVQKITGLDLETIQSLSKST